MGVASVRDRVHHHCNNFCSWGSSDRARSNTAISKPACERGVHRVRGEVFGDTGQFRLMAHPMVVRFSLPEPTRTATNLVRLIGRNRLTTLWSGAPELQCRHVNCRREAQTMRLEASLFRICRTSIFPDRPFLQPPLI